MSGDLIEFLRARLDEDEAKTEGMVREKAPIFRGLPSDWLAGVDIFVSPDRWQAEIEAKRRIIDEHPASHLDRCRRCVEEGTRRPVPYPCRTMKLLALPYANHPDYREEWRP